MSGARGAEHRLVGQRRHAEPVAGSVEQRDQHVELGDRKLVPLAQFGVQILQHGAMQHQQRGPRLPLLRLHELMAVST